MAKTWLITGSSRGFGWELARAVLEDGDHVVATARRPEQLDDLVRQYGERVRTCALDVTDVEAAQAAVKLAVARAERVPDREVRRRRLLRGPQQRSQTARHQSHDHRARRVPHQLGDAHHTGQCGLRTVGGCDDPLT